MQKYLYSGIFQNINILLFGSDNFIYLFHHKILIKWKIEQKFF
jgi:hypothetical protein